jgi:uncharacterized membrane protein
MEFQQIVQKEFLVMAEILLDRLVLVVVAAVVLAVLPLTMTKVVAGIRLCINKFILQAFIISFERFKILFERCCSFRWK